MLTAFHAYALHSRRACTFFPAWGCGSKVLLQVTFSSVFACPPALVCSTASGSLVMLPRALSHQASEAGAGFSFLAYGARRVCFHHPGWHFLVQSVRASSRVRQYLAVWSWQQLLATSARSLVRCRSLVLHMHTPSVLNYLGCALRPSAQHAGLQQAPRHLLAFLCEALCGSHF